MKTKGYIFKSKIGNFTVTYAGFRREVGIKLTNCGECDLSKIAFARKQESCEAFLHEVSDSPFSCPLPIGYVFKKIKGGI